ncbi:MAG: addiction module protein [Planctomycetales bacterium]|nr:addiction module protein [Planctomycetales bacterium]
MSNEISLDGLTVAEKVQLLERVWSELCRSTIDVSSPDWHREILEERQRRLLSGEATVSTWHEAKARLMKLGQ